MGGEVIQGKSSVAPEGIFCQRPDIYRRRLPDMPDQFSVKIETVDEVDLFISTSSKRKIKWKFHLMLNCDQLVDYYTHKHTMHIFHSTRIFRIGLYRNKT